MASAPPGLAQRARFIIDGSLRVSLYDIDQLLRDLGGFEDGPAYVDGLLDARNRTVVEEMYLGVENGDV